MADGWPRIGLRATDPGKCAYALADGREFSGRNENGPAEVLIGRCQTGGIMALEVAGAGSGEVPREELRDATAVLQGRIAPAAALAGTAAAMKPAAAPARASARAAPAVRRRIDMIVPSLLGQCPTGTVQATLRRVPSERSTSNSRITV